MVKERRFTVHIWAPGMFYPVMLHYVSFKRAKERANSAANDLRLACVTAKGSNTILWANRVLADKLG